MMSNHMHSLVIERIIHIFTQETFTGKMSDGMAEGEMACIMTHLHGAAGVTETMIENTIGGSLISRETTIRGRPS